MPAMANKWRKTSLQVAPTGYALLLAEVSGVIEEARRAAACSVNVVMPPTILGSKLSSTTPQFSSGAPSRARSHRSFTVLVLRQRIRTAISSSGRRAAFGAQMRQLYLLYP